MTPDEIVQLVRLANTLGVQLDPKRSNAEALEACTVRAEQLVEALEELKTDERVNPGWVLSSCEPPKSAPACPRCGDREHQEFVGADEVKGIRFEKWNCANPAASHSATTGLSGCGSYTHVKETP